MTSIRSEAFAKRQDGRLRSQSDRMEDCVRKATGWKTACYKNDFFIILYLMKFLSNIFPLEIVDQILLHLSTKDILTLGKENVSKYVWLMKKDEILIQSCKYGDLAETKYLIANGANIHINNNAALNLAAENGHLEIIKLLIENGAKIPHKNRAFSLSVDNGHFDVVKFIFSKLKNKDIENDTILHLGAVCGSLPLVKNSIEKYNVDIHSDDDYALRISANNGFTEIVRYLIDNGADIHANNNEALRHSARGRKLEVVKLLIKCKADIHANNNEALRGGIRKGNFEIVKLLIEHQQHSIIQSDYNELLCVCAENSRYDSTIYLNILDLLIKNSPSIKIAYKHILQYSQEHNYKKLVNHLKKTKEQYSLFIHERIALLNK
jgi:ankyrin repeat protein